MITCAEKTKRRKSLHQGKGRDEQDLERKEFSEGMG